MIILFCSWKHLKHENNIPIHRAAVFFFRLRITEWISEFEISWMNEYDQQSFVDALHHGTWNNSGSLDHHPWCNQGVTGQSCYTLQTVPFSDARRSGQHEIITVIIPIAAAIFARTVKTTCSIIINIKRGELHSVVEPFRRIILQTITGVPTVATHVQCVAVGFIVDQEGVRILPRTTTICSSPGLQFSTGMRH